MHTLCAQKIHLTNTRDLTTLATEVARPRALPSNTYMLALRRRAVPALPPSARWMVAVARRDDDDDNDKSNKEKMTKTKKRKLHHTNGKQRVKERASESGNAYRDRQIHKPQVLRIRG